MKKLLMFLFGVLLLFGLVTNATAVPFDFVKLEQNTTLPGDQFSGDFQISDSQVVFTISNEGSTLCTIFSVYFDDNSGLLAGINGVPGQLFFDTGVAFVIPEDELKDLPGGQNLDPPFSTDWEMRRSGNAANGVDPGESLEITFNLVPDTIVDDDVLDALTDQTLRIGLHVGGIGGNDGDSDSFITGAPVPEPATMLLLGSGLLGLGVVGRKKLLKRA